MIDWDGLFIAAHSIGIQPSDFWEMTHGEAMLLINHPTKAASEKGPRFTDDEIKDMLDFAHGVA